MTFTSFNFLLFFPLVVVMYNLVPRSWRMVFLLLVSYFFYINMQPVYALLLALVTLSTYLFTKWINQAKSEKNKQRLEIAGIIVTVLPLFFFKYFGFLNETLAMMLETVGCRVEFPKIAWALPVGISFYTFMAIGYIVDVYNEEVDFEPNICVTGLFLSFFPLVLSGPIERAGNMFDQFKRKDPSTYEDVVTGLKWVLWGYFMKLGVADRLSLYVDAVFNNVAGHNGTTLTLVTLLYPIQEYADFGGYSLIAIGVARCLGFRVMPNFKRPFFATSMSEFWHRWHISLIKWLTDYIYTPLSFALRAWQMWGVVAALMLTFLISGLWHGAAMTFVVWGLLQGIFLSVEACCKVKRAEFEKRHQLNSKWWYRLLCCSVVYILFTFSELIGRCASMAEAWDVIVKIATERGALFQPSYVPIILSLSILLFVDVRDEFFPNKFKLFENKYIAVRWASYICIALAILALGVLDSSQFIYFQF